MIKNFPHSRGIGASFLVAGLLLLAVFVVIPSSIMGLAEQLWDKYSYVGLGVSSLIFVLIVALFSCYLGIRYLLRTPTLPIVHVVQLGVNIVLSLLAQLSLLWLFWEIHNLSLSLSWVGFVIGLITNFVILIIGCFTLYLLLAFIRESDAELESLEVVAQSHEAKHEPTTIEAQIYENYRGQIYQPWDFKPLAVADIEIFHPVPYLPDADDWLVLRRPWRVILEMFRLGYENSLTIGLDIYGDIVLGRNQNDEVGRIGLDLSQYDARNLGVSHQHMLLRPTGDAIYVVDLGSKNGTIIDDEPIEPYSAVKLEGDYQIELGTRLIFRLHIIQKPDEP